MCRQDAVRRTAKPQGLQHWEALGYHGSQLQVPKVFCPLYGHGHGPSQGLRRRGQQQYGLCRSSCVGLCWDVVVDATVVVVGLVAVVVVMVKGANLVNGGPLELGRRATRRLDSYK